LCLCMSHPFLFLVRQRKDMGRQGGKIVKTYTYKKYIKKSMLYSVYSV
jgi:hypothetical protein